jgi:hypothetical protein
VESLGAQMAPAAFARKVILKAVEWNARIAVERNPAHGIAARSWGINCCVSRVR